MTAGNIAYFTPSMNDPEVLEAIFTARQPLAERLMSRIRDSAETGNRHYSLVIGPRGIGKTHLVSLLYYRVKKDAALHDRLRIAWLQEDPYAASSYARLLRAILVQLNIEYGIPGWAGRLAAIEELGKVEHIEDTLEHALTEYLEKRVLLLIAENLDEIFKGLGDDGQKKLRAFLQSKGAATILATSTTLLSDLEDRDRPFFGVFQKDLLAPFTFDECVDVLVRIAEYREDEPLAKTLTSPQGRARIRAVHHLADGNPRIYVIFYQFLSRESLDQLKGPFMKLVDELMPYYQARMQILSPQQRALIDIIRKNESPIAVRDIAKTAFITSQSASSDLKILRDLGYVDATKFSRESLYELREPLMRICLSAKEQRGQELALFMDFLRIWFTPDELKALGGRLGRQTRDYKLYREAIKESRRKQDAWVSAQHRKIQECLSAGDDELALAQLQFLCERVPLDWATWDILKGLLEKKGEIGKLVELAQLRADQDPLDALRWNQLDCAYGLAGDHAAALEATARAISLSPYIPVFWHNHLVALGNLRPADLGEAATRALMTRENPGSDADWWYLRGWCFEILDQSKEAVHALAKAVSLRRGDYRMWWGLQASLQNLEAINSLLATASLAVDLLPDNPWAWRGLARALSATGSYKDALEAMDEAIALSPQDGHLPGERLCLFLQLNDFAGARAALDHFEAWRNSNADPYTFAWKAHFFLATGDNEPARDALGAYVHELKAKSMFGKAHSPIWVVGRTKDPAAWRTYITLWLEVFEEAGELAMLGAALVRDTMRNPAILPPALARAWTQAWQQASANKPELQIPLRLMDIGVRFMETEDRSVLLQLPIEQRSLLEPEIERYLWASGKVRHEIDDEIDALIETVKHKRAESPHPAKK